MTYIISGANKETGADVETVIDGDSELWVTSEAANQGILVSNVKSHPLWKQIRSAHRLNIIAWIARITAVVLILISFTYNRENHRNHVEVESWRWDWEALHPPAETVDDIKFRFAHEIPPDYLKQHAHQFEMMTEIADEQMHNTAYHFLILTGIMLFFTSFLISASATLIDLKSRSK